VAKGKDSKEEIVLDELDIVDSITANHHRIPDDTPGREDITNDHMTAVIGDPTAIGATTPDYNVRADHFEVIDGLRRLASRTPIAGLRARLLTIAGGFCEQLIGDREEAMGLLADAASADPSPLFIHRERALIRLRAQEDHSEVLRELAEALAPQADGTDSQARLRGRVSLYCAALSVGREATGDSQPFRFREALENSASEDLKGTPLAALWAAYRSADSGKFAAMYLGAIRHCRGPELKAALLVDLATGLECGAYAPAPGRSVRPIHLLREATHLRPGDRLLGVLLSTKAAKGLQEHHEHLQSQIENDADLPTRLRAAVVAAALGKYHAALSCLALKGTGLEDSDEDEELPDGPDPSTIAATVLDRLLSRLAVMAGKHDIATQALNRLAEAITDPLGLVILDVERASIAVHRRDPKAVRAHLAAALASRGDLQTALGEIEREQLYTGEYEKLLERLSGTVKAELLESRLDQFDDAVEAYQEGLAADASDDAAFRGLLRLYSISGRVADVCQLIEARSKESETTGEKVRLLHLAARMQAAEVGKHEEAAALYSSLIDADPMVPSHLHELAGVRFRAGDTGGACEMLSGVLPKLTDVAERAAVLADWVAIADRPILAGRLEQLREAAQCSPLARHRFETLCLREGRWEELAALAAEGGGSRRGDRILGAYAELRSGDVAKAIELMESWVAEHDSDPSARDLLSRAYLEAGREADAVAMQPAAPPSPNSFAALWRDWWTSDFAPACAQALTDVLVSPEDIRIIWAATYAGARDPEERAIAGTALYQCDPTDVRIQCLQETALKRSGSTDELLQLYLSWSNDGDELDRNYLLHAMATCYRALERDTNAETMWSTLVQVEPRFLPARLGRLSAFESLGWEERAATLRKDIEAELGTTLDNLDLMPVLSDLMEVTSPLLQGLALLELSGMCIEAGEQEAARACAVKALAVFPASNAVARQLIRLGPGAEGTEYPVRVRSGASVVPWLIGGDDVDPEALGALSRAARDEADAEAIGGLLVATRKTGKRELIATALDAWSNACREVDLRAQIDRELEEGGQTARPDASVRLQRDVQDLAAELELLESGEEPSAAVLAERGRRLCSAGLLSRAGQLYEVAGNLPGAEALYYEALSLDVEEEVVAWGGPLDRLASFLDDQGRLGELDVVIDDLLSRSEATTLTVRLLEMAARWARDEDGKIRSLLRLSEVVPTDWSYCQRALTAAASAGKWALLPDVLERERTIIGANDPSREPLIWWEIGEVHRRQGDMDSALEAYQKGGCHAAEKRLLVENHRWEEVIAADLRRLEQPAAPDRLAAIHVDIAGLQEFRLNHVGAAHDHYMAAHDADPGNLSALLGIVRLSERAGHPVAAIDALGRLGKLVGGLLGTTFRLQRAELIELNAEDSEGAVTEYRKLSESGLGEIAAPGIERCLLSVGQISTYLDEHRASDLGDDLRYLERSEVDSAPRPESTQGAAATWAACLFRNRDHNRESIRVAALGLASSLEDASAAAEVLRLAVLMGLSVRSGADVEVLRQLVALDPSDELALLVLEAKARPGSDAEALALRARLRQAPEGPQSTDALLGWVRHYAVQGAEDDLWDSLELLSHSAPEIRLADQFRAALSSGTQDPEIAAEYFESEAAQARSPVRKAELLLRAAQLRRRQLGEFDAAVAALRTALEVHPASKGVFEELRDVYTSHNDYEGLFALLQYRYHAVVDPKERLTVLGNMAELAHNRFRDDERTEWSHLEIVRADPTQVRSYRILAEIYLKQSRIKEAAQALESVAKCTKQPSLLVNTHLEVANLYMKRLGDPARAAVHYREVLKKEAKKPLALQGLAEAAEATKSWDEAVEALVRLTQLAPNSSKSSGLYLRLAKVLDNRGRPDDAKAVEGALRRAVEVAPNNRDAVLSLARYARASGRASAVESVVRRVTDHLSFDSKSREERVALQLVFNLFEAAGWGRRAFTAACVLKFLGHASERSEQARTERPLDADAWRWLKPIPPEETAVVFPPGLHSDLVHLLRALDGPLKKAFPSRAKVLGASRRTKISRSVAHPALRVAAMLGRSDVEVYASLQSGNAPVVEPGSPAPALFLPADFPSGSCPDPLLWSVGYALAPSAMGFTTMFRLPQNAWFATVAHVVRRFLPSYLESEVRPIRDSELLHQVDAALNKKVLNEIEPLIDSLAELSSKQLQVQYKLLQTAFTSLAALACQDVRAVLRETARSAAGRSAVKGMVPFLLREHFARLQTAAGIE
jgi:tetratricopeptide (TPR) repeat protein